MSRGPASAERSGRGASQRQLRVGEEIRHVLAAAFARGEFRDPVLAQAHITVTEVRTSPDLKRATVFVARLGRSDVAALLPALARAGAFLRGEVGRALHLRYAPELHFQADSTLEEAMRIEALLHSPEIARDLG